MKSALFVDFDNVYTQLRALQPAAAERFARQPTEWIRWLVESLGIPEGHEPTARRRLLVRRCYLNPNWYQTYRHAFLRAGFEIVDCPPVTSQGKTSTDIHMVLDIIELLQHETRYDEFIVLSADADFTPVLRKLRRYDRRTSVLAIGFPSAAYQASADLLIDERLFVEQALGLPMEPVETEVLGAPKALPAAAMPSPDSTAAKASTAQLAEIARLIELAVALSPTPVAAGPLALRLRQAHAAVLEQWNGHGAFKPFFRSLGLNHLVWLNGSGGRIADPLRHAADVAAVVEAADSVPGAIAGGGAEGLPTADPDAATAPVPQSTEAELDAAWAGHESLLPIAREVCQLTGAPLLAPPTARAILESLSADLILHEFDLTATAYRVRAACLARTPSIDVGMREVVFTLRGMQLNGHAFGRGQDDAPTLAKRLCNQLLFLCQREEMVIDDHMRAQIRLWIGGDLPG
ncbi:MAG TPA: NYN domain-containing protein [Xanthomonadales bacterium]|nr:NYN domain-containing protein [Xanthomonadales bacterium]